MEPYNKTTDTRESSETISISLNVEKTLDSLRRRTESSSIAVSACPSSEQTELQDISPDEHDEDSSVTDPENDKKKLLENSAKLQSTEHLQNTNHSPETEACLNDHSSGKIVRKSSKDHLVIQRSSLNGTRTTNIENSPDDSLDSNSENVDVTAECPTNLKNIEVGLEDLNVSEETQNQQNTSFDDMTSETREGSRNRSVGKLERTNSNSNVGRNNIIVGGVTVIDKTTALNTPREKQSIVCTTCSPMIQKYSNSYLDYHRKKKRRLSFDTSVLDLPDTTLLKIFSYLTEEQVCNVACVCHE